MNKTVIDMYAAAFKANNWHICQIHMFRRRRIQNSIKISDYISVIMMCTNRPRYHSKLMENKYSIGDLYRNYAFVLG